MYVANPLEVPSDVFMYTLQPTRVAMLTEGPSEEEQLPVAQHWTYSQELLAKGVIVFAGRTVDTSDQSFATCVIRAQSEQQARAIMEVDPGVAAGVFRARLFRFQPMLVGEWPPRA